MSVSLIPLRDYLLVEMREAPQADKDSVIIAPDNVKIPCGTVLARGPLVEKAQVGDLMIFLPGNGIPTWFDGRMVLLVQESSCFGRYVDDPPLTVVPAEISAELDNILSGCICDLDIGTDPECPVHGTPPIDDGLIPNPPQQEG